MQKTLQNCRYVLINVLLLLQRLTSFMLHGQHVLLLRLIPTVVHACVHVPKQWIKPNWKLRERHIMFMPMQTPATCWSISTDGCMHKLRASLWQLPFVQLVPFIHSRTCTMQKLVYPICPKVSQSKCSLSLSLILDLG